MQSPPASADATSVIILSLVFARPGASPRSRRCRTSSGRPRCRARVAGRSSPALATKRRSSKVIWIRSGWLRGSIYWVLLFRGRVFATKPLSQKHRSTFLPLQDANPTPSFGGFGFRRFATSTVAATEVDPVPSNDVAIKAITVHPFEGFPGVSGWGLFLMATVLVGLVFAVTRRRLVTERREK